MLSWKLSTVWYAVLDSFYSLEYWTGFLLQFFIIGWIFIFLQFDMLAGYFFLLFMYIGRYSTVCFAGLDTLYSFVCQAGHFPEFGMLCWILFTVWNIGLDTTV